MLFTRSAWVDCICVSVCPSFARFISYTAKWIFIKFGAGDLNQKLSDKFNFGSYQTNKTRAS